jgi:DNA-binding transcriptional LysR family regulator
MNAYELGIFRAVVEQRGFGRAARVAHLSQPAVSQAIRRLEESAGAVLLQRGRPPQLTPAGRRVYEHAVDVLARDELVRRQLAELARGHVGILVLAASQALSRQLLPQLVQRFLTAYPTAGLQLETQPSRQILQAVADGRLELGLGPYSRAMHGLTTLPLGTQRMVLYAGRRNPRLRALRRGGVPALAAESLVTSHLEERAPRRGSLREHFGAVWVVQSLDLRLRLVHDGLAVGYLPEDTVRAAGLRRELVSLEKLPFGAIERTVGLFASQKRELSSIARAFWELAKDGSSDR